MTKLIPLALNAACAAALAMMATGAAAQTPHAGRTAFDAHGCRTCHAYSSRRGAPSVRDMLVTFQGEPELALKGIDQKDKHAAELKAGAISEQEMRAMAEWIAGSAFLEPEPAEPPRATAPAVAAPVAAAEIPAPPAAPTPIEATALPPQTASEPAPIQTPIARRAIAGSVVGLAIEPGKKSDRLIISLSGKEPDELNMESVDGKLVISLPGYDRSARVPEILAATKQARAVGAVQASDDAGTLVLTVTPRSGDLKYSATQSRNRLAIELSSVPSKRKPAPSVIAVAPIPAVAAGAKLATAPKAPAEVATPATKPAAAKAAAPAKAAAADNAKTRSETKAKPEPKAKPSADAPVKKEAESQVTVKKDVETKPALAAAPKEAEDKAKRDAAAAAKAEADMLASLKASAEALRGNAAADGDSEAKSRRDRSKLKAPEKFRDEPCPPLASSDPIGTVDEARAKDIIDRVGCPQCHAFVQKKTGPPFKRVFEKVKGNPSCVIQRLKKNKEHNDEGVTDDLKGQEFKIVADYLATRAK